MVRLPTSFAVALAVVLPIAVVLSPCPSAAQVKPRPHGLKPADLKQQVIWGSEWRLPEGAGLAFGGQDQLSDDGRPHTRILKDGQWKDIHEELRAANPFQKHCTHLWALRTELKDIASVVRAMYFRGLPAEAEAEELAKIAPRYAKLCKDLAAPPSDARIALAEGEIALLLAVAQEHVDAALKQLLPLPAAPGRLEPDLIKSLRQAQEHVERAAEALDAEPPARALSPIVYDAKTKWYVIFGGDHLDYLTNDTWVFRPASRRWFQLHSKTAPAPRAGHVLTATGDGKVTVSGGYTYAKNTDYMGGQYLDLADGQYVFDLLADRFVGEWKGDALVPADARVYRTGPFHPDFYLAGPRPDAAAFEAKLKALPANEWVATNPPYRPKQQRDWGTAVIDTRHDLILRWSGGHCAHGGTDVPHFHFATNRWELAFPVEFPLGQLYSNTSYPAGYNFNLRPWMTGHSYQNYAFDSLSGRMVQTGHNRDFYVYDPNRADWIGRAGKPKGMAYDSCFYDLTLCTTPKGVVCWTKEGRVFLYQPGKDGNGLGAWTEAKLTGAKLPGAKVDHSTSAYDSRRDRVLFFVKEYGKKPYDGVVWAMDMKTYAVESLTPAGAAGAAAIAWIDRCCYDAGGDVVLLATYMNGAAEPRTPTPAYDCAANGWVGLDLKYAVAKGDGHPRREMPEGHSAGVMYDPKRQLIWGTDTNSQVYVLRLDVKAADPGVLPTPPPAAATATE